MLCCIGGGIVVVVVVVVVAVVVIVVVVGFVVFVIGVMFADLGVGSLKSSVRLLARFRSRCTCVREVEPPPLELELVELNEVRLLPITLEFGILVFLLSVFGFVFGALFRSRCRPSLEPCARTE